MLPCSTSYRGACHVELLLHGRLEERTTQSYILEQTAGPWTTSRLSGPPELDITGRKLFYSDHSMNHSVSYPPR
ncbi:Os03g0560200 [Oryza sativa Japonica Group]|uniref:Os03g0560200 protein n=3 Tax=Oryza sativa TaxID=4530 RepID=B9F9A5_ORYSJ|nr:hypothetical protein OsI_12255 [Oryza sativa Indica Group]EEE59353.1 hypothetical protein OsJ_11441 [Oryza sativa Japonica Group]KAB8092363.1 hypothetical protein EE612_018418 [Oryza sativa]KAF2939907.1 hypothetical protein DAI22_03g231150 [Oryza sativa Japonica Group]BAS84928.1 Os03g0560200 [Oryza sativa Japonica Group]